MYNMIFKASKTYVYTIYLLYLVIKYIVNINGSFSLLELSDYF